MTSAPGKESRPPMAPLPLMSDIRGATAYPVDSLPQVLRDATLAIAEHVQAPLALAGQCVLGAIAHIAQTRRNAPHLHNPSGMPCSLNMLTLGVSGDRKSACRDLAFAVIDTAEHKAYQIYQQSRSEILNSANALRGKARDEYLIANPLPADPCRQYTDATFEPIVGDFIRGKPAASWDSDEGGQLLGGSSLKADTRAATLGGLCKAFDKGFFSRRRSAGNLEGSGTAEHRRLSIHLMAQPVAVKEALEDPLLMGQGFLPRFLFAYPDSIAGTRLLSVEKLARNSYDDPRLQHFWDTCRDLMASAEYIDPETSEVHPPVLALNAGATQTWMDFYNDVEREQQPLGKFADMRPFAGRAAEIARRLGAVLACAEGAGLLDAECMHRACTLVNYSLSEWLRYCAGETPKSELTRANELVGWLLSPSRALHWSEFHRDKLSKSGPPAMRPAKVRDKLLEILVAHNYLITSDNKNFQLNPLAKSENRAEPQESQVFTGGWIEREREGAGHNTPLSAMLLKLSAGVRTT